MEAIGAIASIVQVAQLGAQLSITLYRVAETIGCANRDVQYVAKDIALFSAVLKDLGKTLERGQKSKVYRDAAYESSRLIVKECEEVFKEIDEILKKSTKEGSTQDAKVSISRVDKFMWVFRRSRVQLLRGNLESLKTTILLQVAVLSYADKVSESSSEIDAADDLLALRSLVLAEDTAKRQFTDLLIQDSSSGDELSPAATSSNNVGLGKSGDQPAVNSLRHIELSVVNSSEPRPINPSPRILDHVPDKTQLSKTLPVIKPELKARYAQIWGGLDRLEFALRKVETAKWEHDRIQDNLQFGLRDGSDWKNQQMEAVFLERLERDLLSYGLSHERVSHALTSLKAYDSWTGCRSEIEYLVPKDEMLIKTLRSIGALCKDDEEGTECCTITRWMPEFFDDILWSHTHKLLLEHPGPSLSYPSQETTPYSNQGHSPIVVAKREQGKKTSVLQKSSKVGMACDACRTKRTKCSHGKPRCRSCKAKGLTCNYPTGARGRGMDDVKSSRQPASKNIGKDGESMSADAGPRPSKKPRPIDYYDMDFEIDMDSLEGHVPEFAREEVPRSIDYDMDPETNMDSLQGDVPESAREVPRSMREMLSPPVVEKCPKPSIHGDHCPLETDPTTRKVNELLRKWTFLDGL